MAPILATLYIAGFVIASAGIAIDAYFFVQMRRYVRGSYQRYLAATMYIVGGGVEAIGYTAMTVACIIDSNFIGVAIFMLVTILRIISIAVTLCREDNWFNDRWNKLKQAIKKAYKAVTSVRINVPRPVVA